MWVGLTCFEISHGRVTAPKSHAVISIDLVCLNMYSILKQILAFLLSILKVVDTHLNMSLCSSLLQLNCPDKTHSKNLVLLLLCPMDYEDNEKKSNTSFYLIANLTI